MRNYEPERWKILVLVCAVLTCILLVPVYCQANMERDCTKAKESHLKLPSNLPLVAYESQLYEFILSRKYDTELTWYADKGVRDTGPWVKGKYYGVHPAVRIYYSPKVMYWLTGDPSYWKEGKVPPKKPREGAVPDGGMIVKEMFSPPAVRWADTSEEELAASLTSSSSPGWTVMVKDSAGSKDGWFWGSVYINENLDTSTSTNYPYSGFGLTCLRCHAVAENESTFSSTGNIEGFPGNPVTYYVDDTWKDEDLDPTELPYSFAHARHLVLPSAVNNIVPCISTNMEFLQTYSTLSPVMLKKIHSFPPASLDHVVAGDRVVAGPKGAESNDKESMYTVTINTAYVQNGLTMSVSGTVTSSSNTPATAVSIDVIPPDGTSIRAITNMPLTASSSFSWSGQLPGSVSIPAGSRVKVWSNRQSNSTALLGGWELYLTSDQCMGCHSGLSTGFGPVMFLDTSPSYKTGLNVSPYGEWRWSPMGLAGRDPIFFAQLESELSILKDELPPEKADFFGQQTINTCLLCHGAMGKRQFDIDQGVGREYWKADFKLKWYLDSDRESKHFKYGALAREGISCLVCHHWKDEYPGDLKGFLNNSITGQFFADEPGELIGPFNKIATLPMQNALGITPKYNEHIKSARLCGSCHTIDLPVVDYPLKDPPVLPKGCGKVEPDLNVPDKNPNFEGFQHKIEQATYLEWLNSQYQNEIQPVSTETAKTCQECHMPRGYTSLKENIGIPLIDIQNDDIDIKQIKTKIATIEDQDYPEAGNRADTEKITVPIRDEGFTRHKHQGLNIFMAEVFNQFSDVLGVRLDDYETGAYGDNFAINNFVENARRSAKIEINNFKVTSEGATVPDYLVSADVKITNLTGHRFPSGVGFRRAFIEFLIIDNSISVVDNTAKLSKVVWGSGQTNSVGVIVDGNGNILPSEFLTDGKFQKHRETIENPDQVQIYEELTKNAKGEFTTSFTHRDCEVKNNRLLPIGWKKEGPSPGAIPKAFLEATYPGELASKDPHYNDGSGTDVVKYRVKLPAGVNPKYVSVQATLYSQAWAPYYLNQRFSNVPDGSEGASRRRLYYLLSNLNVTGTPIEDWKLELVSATAMQREVP